MSLELSPAEEQRLTTALAALSAPGTESVAALAAASPRELFCQYWPIVKQVLQFLSASVPSPIKAAIALVIAAGDAAANIICR